jgi:aspartyl protease family protein
MSDGQGPWDIPPPERKRPEGDGRSRRGLIWLLIILGAAAGVWLLNQLFPGKISGSNWVYPLNGLGFLALVSSGMLASHRLGIGRIARYLAIWSGIAAVLVIGYVFHGDLMDAGLRLRSQLVPTYAMAQSPGVVALSQTGDGGYEVVADVNDQPVRFAVDTGASDVVLSPADAKRLGFDVAALNYGRTYETANGAGHGASATIDKLSIGPIQLRNVPVTINSTEMSDSLLGMAFLRRLDSFEFKRGQLILRAPRS